MTYRPLVTPGVKRGTESLRDHLFDGEVNHHPDDPDLFAKLYDPLIKFDYGNAFSVVADGRANMHRQVAEKKEREILTGVFSFDDPVLELQRAFVRDANAEAQPMLNEQGFSLNGLHATADSIKTVSGCPQVPVSALPKNNAFVRQEDGLAEKMNAKQVAISKAVWRLVWSRLKPSAINIPRDSASGSPRNVNDHEYKLQFALAAFVPDTMESILRTFMSGDAHALQRDFEIACIMGTNVRWQVDRPGKKRFYWSLDDVRREESPKKREITTKVDLFGRLYPDFAAMRTRLVNAGPWTMNVLLQAYATAAMYSLFERFKETWHRDEVTLDQEMSGYYTVFSDVSNYDQSFSEEQIDLIHEVMGEYVRPEIVQMSKSLYYSAYYTKPLGPGDKPTVFGNPWDYLEKQVIAGNRSGHALTSLLAKVTKVIDTLYYFDKLGHDVLANLEPILRGEYIFGMVNNGDDEIAWFETKRDYDLYNALRADESATDRMFNVVPEEGAVFSGKVFQLVGDRQYKAVERITTPFERILCPERGIGGHFRKFWPIGVLQRHNNRLAHPILDSWWDVFHHNWRKIAEPHYGSFLGIVQRAHAELPFDAASLAWKDAMVLEDPSKLHHRFTPDEIREDVYESAFRRLQPEFFSFLFQEPYFSGSLL
jgi:hypothetical protein